MSDNSYPAYPASSAAYAEMVGSLATHGHLDAYRRGLAIAHDDVGRRAPQIELLRQTRVDPIELYRELRSLAPVLPLPDLGMVLVTRDRDVRRVLDNPTLFTVRDYAFRMEPVLGPYMLDRDSDPYYNVEEKSWMRSLMLRSDVPRIQRIARDAAVEAITTQTAADGTIDVVPALARGVPVRVVQDYFGLRAPTAEMLGWSHAIQDSFFHNLSFLRGLRGDLVRAFRGVAPDVHDAQIEALAVHRAGIAAGAGLRAFLDRDIATRTAAILAEDTVLSRLLRVNEGLSHPKTLERIRFQVMGALIGAVETADAAIVQSLHQLLRRPAELQRAREAALALAPDDDVAHSRFAGYVWEALRFHPINPFVARYAEKDTVIGSGRDAVEVKAGTIVLAATFSAMHDPRRVQSPDEFRPERPEGEREMLLGYGQHRCLGDHVAEVMVPEVVRQIVLLPELARVEPAAPIEMNFGIDFGPRQAFPEHYVVRRGPRPASAAPSTRQ